MGASTQAGSCEAGRVGALVAAFGNRHARVFSTCVCIVTWLRARGAAAPNQPLCMAHCCSCRAHTCIRALTPPTAAGPRGGGRWLPCSASRQARPPRSAAACRHGTSAAHAAAVHCRSGRQEGGGGVSCCHARKAAPPLPGQTHAAACARHAAVSTARAADSHSRRSRRPRTRP
jgi:hypothetical protein